MYGSIIYIWRQLDRIQYIIILKLWSRISIILTNVSWTIKPITLFPQICDSISWCELCLSLLHSFFLKLARNDGSDNIRKSAACGSGFDRPGRKIVNSAVITSHRFPSKHDSYCSSACKNTPREHRLSLVFFYYYFPLQYLGTALFDVVSSTFFSGL